MLTKEEVALALPPNLKGAATQQFTDLINNIASDPLVAENVRENFISYTSVLKDGKYKTEDYLNAVAYVSYKLMGLTNLEAYSKTFPARHQALVAKGTSSKDISAYVAAYNKGKLVNAILEQTMVPFWVLNQDNYQKAINANVDILTNSQSDIARAQAANSILTHLKPPEPKNININLGLQENSGLTELKQSLAQLAEKQRELIQEGVETRLIAAQPLVEEGEFTEVGPD